MHLKLKTVLIFFIFLLPLGCYSSKDWTGSYTYEADLGENAAGMPMIVEYNLVLRKDSCVLDVVGYQVNEKLICSTVSTQDALSVTFTSYSNGSIKNAYDVEVYKVGSVLFELRREKKQVVTQWRGLKPTENMSDMGNYFSVVKLK